MNAPETFQLTCHGPPCSCSSFNISQGDEGHQPSRTKVINARLFSPLIFILHYISDSLPPFSKNDQIQREKNFTTPGCLSLLCCLNFHHLEICLGHQYHQILIHQGEKVNSLASQSELVKSLPSLTQWKWAGLRDTFDTKGRSLWRQNQVKAAWEHMVEKTIKFIKRNLVHED